MDLAGIGEMVEVLNRAIQPVSVEFASHPVFFEAHKVAPRAFNMLAFVTVSVSDGTQAVEIGQRAANRLSASNLSPAPSPNHPRSLPR